MLTPSQRKAFQDALASVNTVRPEVEFLERIAGAAPHIADDVKELRVRLDYLQSMAETCLAVDREMQA